MLWLQRASSLTRSLQVAFPAVTILELPAELWRWGQDKDRVTAGIGVLLLGWWLSLQRDSSCRRSILIFSICPVVCEPHQSSGDSAASPVAAWQSDLQKPSASHTFLFLQCIPGYSAQYSCIPTPLLSSKTNHRMAERGDEQDGFFC